MPFARQCLIIVAVILLTTACRQRQLSSSDINLELTVSDMLVGETTLLISVRDQDGNAIANPGSLNLRGDMDHAGMIPVFADASTSIEGVFTLPFQWTMAGGWILEASLQLDSGELVTQRFNLEIMSEAGANDMEDMDHADMDHAGAPTETSAVYLHIENRGSSDLTITTARTEAAAVVEFHQTIIEDDIARMEPLPALSLPAGQALHLRPGGIHMMLLELQQNLEAGSSIVVKLVLDTGDVVALSVPIMQMFMGGDASEIDQGGLVFSQIWARPASAGGMSEADQEEMQMDGESSE